MVSSPSAKRTVTLPGKLDTSPMWLPNQARPTRADFSIRFARPPHDTALKQKDMAPPRLLKA